MPRNRCTPRRVSRPSTDACTAWRAGCMHRRRMVCLHGGTARAGPRRGVPRRALTTRVKAATPSQPGGRTPGAWWCGHTRVRRTVAVGRHGARAARPPKTPRGRQARWRRAYRVLCDGRPLAPAGASGTAPHPGAMRTPALWRGAHTEMVDLDGRRTRTVTLRAAGTPSRTPWRGRVLCGPPSAAPLPPCHRSHRVSSFF